jgi:hypothetical protein
MTAEELFSKKEFDTLEPERKKAFINLYNALQGKTPEQAVPIVLSFVRTMPNGHKITPQERNAMLAALTADMSPQEKKNVEMIVKMVL